MACSSKTKDGFLPVLIEEARIVGYIDTEPLVKRPVGVVESIGFMV